MNNQEQTISIERISVTSDGLQANGQSGSSSISDDGRFVAVESNATNLVPNDFNGQTDTFIYDRLNQTVELISVAPDGTQANGSSSSGNLSGNGQYLTFASFASNLVSNDLNNQRDIFVYNRLDKSIELVSVASNGTQGNGLSLFSTISDDGRYVAYESAADNLVTGDTNGLGDIFIRDRIDSTTKRINVANNGTQANGASHLDSLSGDGRYVSFTSAADNLVEGDTNGKSDIFVYDRINSTTERISVAGDGIQGNGDSISSSISSDGRYVSFTSIADNLVAGDTNGKSDIFVYDRIDSTIERVSLANDNTQSNGNSKDASISDDGRYVAFLSEGNNLVANDNTAQFEIFVRDRLEQTTIQIGGDSFPTLSGDGQNILFNSSLNTLVANDTNDTGDVFVVTQNDLDLSRFNTDEVHRFYQFEKGFHLYTTDDNEIQVVQEQSAAGQLSYQYEAEKFTVLSDDKDALTGETLVGVKPVYRFFNTETGAHLYTTDENERSVIEDTLTNYNFEGIKYYAFESEPTEIETIPVFRMLNNESGSHLYTIDQNELNYIQANLPNFSFENNGAAVFHVFEL